jgi:hypothetical protein
MKIATDPRRQTQTLKFLVPTLLRGNAYRRRVCIDRIKKRKLLLLNMKDA